MKILLSKSYQNDTRESGAGFTMIELIITIAVLSFGIIGVYGAFIPMVGLNSLITAKFTASGLAQEGFEIARNMAWPSGLAKCALGCQLDYKTGTAAQTFEDALKPYDENNRLNIDAGGFYSYGAGTQTKFTRKVTVVQGQNPDVLKVDVQVFWDYNGKPYSFGIEGYLYNNYQ